MKIQLRRLVIVAIFFNIARSETEKTNKNQQKKCLLLSRQKRQHQKIMALKELSQLKEPEQTGISNLTEFSVTTQEPCSCGHGLCSCCSRILLNLWKQKACVNITYDPDEFAFTAKVMMNDRLLYTKTVSGKNPKPFCIPIPRIPAVRACIRFYNIYFQGRNIHTCINMEGKFQDTTLFKLGMDCVRFGSNGIALVKPEDGGGIGQIEFLPENLDDVHDYVEYDYDGVEDDDNFFNY